MPYFMRFLASLASLSVIVGFTAGEIALLWLSLETFGFWYGSAAWALGILLGGAALCALQPVAEKPNWVDPDDHEEQP